jgi:16S rRNA (cytidine1402-2'-O)-methyltransferase
MSGFSSKSWYFYGFLPHKMAQRESELKKIFALKQTTIIYEAPTRILKLIEQIASIDRQQTIFVAKELTKLNQKYFKASAIDVLNELKSSNLKGEWVVVIEGGVEQDFNNQLSEFVKTLDIPKKEMAKIIAKIENKSTKECYKLLINS